MHEFSVASTTGRRFQLIDSLQSFLDFEAKIMTYVKITTDKGNMTWEECMYVDVLLLPITMLNLEGYHGRVLLDKWLDR